MPLRPRGAGGWGERASSSVKQCTVHLLVAGIPKYFDPGESFVAGPQNCHSIFLLVILTKTTLLKFRFVSFFSTNVPITYLYFLLVNSF